MTSAVSNAISCVVVCPEPKKTLDEPLLMVAPQLVLSPLRAAGAPSI